MIYNLLNWWLNHKHSNWISVVGHLNDCFLWLAKKIRSWKNCDIPKSSVCSSPSVYFIISLDLFPSFYGPNSLQYNLSYSPSGELGVHGESIKEDECSWWGWREEVFYSMVKGQVSECEEKSLDFKNHCLR